MGRRLRRGPDIVEPPELSIVDRFISSVSPEWGLRRAEARARMNLMTRSYEGGGLSRRTEGWRTPSSDANEAARPTLTRLRDRCRDLARNNVWAGRGLRVMVRSSVGTGIMLRLVDPDGRPIETNRAAAVRQAWAAWALTKQIDADARHDIYGLERLVMRTIMQSGEVLVRRRWRRATDGFAVPLQLQVLEGDFLDRTMDGPGRAIGGAPVTRVNGIEFDMLGRRTGYWLFQQHPGSGWLRDMRSVFVPASEILHVYRVDRPGQVVGVPPLAPAIVRTRDLDEYEDASLMRNKIAAMFAGFIRDQNDVDIPGQTERVNPDGTIGDTLEPGMLEKLPPGKDVTFSDPPSVEGYNDYVNGQLRAIAVSLDVTYEQLTGDLRGTNFTSGRMGWITHHEAVEDWRWDVLVPGFCDEAFAWFLQALELTGQAAPSDVVPRWTPPRRTMIDPTAETAASIRQVRAGLSSYSEALREQGYDRDEVLDELEADLKAMRARGLTLETDGSADANRKPADSTGNKDNGGRKPPGSANAKPEK